MTFAVQKKGCFHLHSPDAKPFKSEDILIFFFFFCSTVLLGFFNWNVNTVYCPCLKDPLNVCQQRVKKKFSQKLWMMLALISKVFGSNAPRNDYHYFVRLLATVAVALNTVSIFKCTPRHSIAAKDAQKPLCQISKMWSFGKK